MVEIKNITNMADFKKIPEIQKSAWGFGDREAEPHHLLTRIQKYGGLVQGLFLKEEFIGFTMAVLAKWNGEYFMYSHMTAVTKEHQGQGYGFLLKKAQRLAVLEMGYQIIRWSFDPLESLNAYFNLHRLGVVCKEYERDVYGTGESGLHQGLSTDRVVATWYLQSPRVVRKLTKKEPRIQLRLGDVILKNFDGETAYIEIPDDIRTLKEKSMAQAISWRNQTRVQFETAFDQGFTAGDIVFSKEDQRVFFQLKKKGEMFYEIR